MSKPSIRTNCPIVLETPEAAWHTRDGQRACLRRDASLELSVRRRCLTARPWRPGLRAEPARQSTWTYGAQVCRVSCPTSTNSTVQTIREFGTACRLGRVMLGDGLQTAPCALSAQYSTRAARKAFDERCSGSTAARAANSMRASRVMWTQPGTRRTIWLHPYAIRAGHGSDYGGWTRWTR